MIIWSCQDTFTTQTWFSLCNSLCKDYAVEQHSMPYVQGAVFHKINCCNAVKYL